MLKAPRDYSSGELAFQASAKRPIDLHFLEEALEDFVNPRIERVEVHARGTMTTGVGATFTVGDFYKLVPQVLVEDTAGPRVDLDWAGLLVANYLLLGPQVLMMPDAIIAEQTAAPFELIIPIPITGWKGQYNPNDTRPHIREFVKRNGGRMSIWMPPTTVITGVTIVTMTYEVVVHVREGFSDEVPARLCLLRDDATKREDNYDIGGQLVGAVLYGVDNDGTGLESHSAYVEFDSTSLKKVRRRFSTEAARVVADGVGGALGNDSIFVSGGARIIQAPPSAGTDGPVLERLHLKFDAAPFSYSQLLKVVITDRSWRNVNRIAGRAGARAIADGNASVGTPKGKRAFDKVPAELRRFVAIRAGK